MSDHPPSGDDRPTCPNCGWSQFVGHEATCWPEAGRAAQRLIDFLALHRIESTRVGHGPHAVAFTIANALMTIVFRVNRNGTFTLHRTFARRLNETDAGKLAVALELFAQSCEARDA